MQNTEFEMKNQSLLFTKPKTFSIKKKRDFKRLLQKTVKLDTAHSKTILIGMEFDKSDSERNFLFEEILEGLGELNNIQVVIIGQSKEHLNEYKNIKYLANSPKNVELLSKCVDLYLLPKNQTEEEACLKYGTPSIYFESELYNGMLSAFHPLEETGNSFPIFKKNKWHLLEAIIRAKETYGFPYDWSSICKNAFSVGQSN